MNINSTLEMFMGAAPKMEVYWEFTRKGQKLVLDWDGKKEMIGGVRETKSGFDAFAKTFSMTPERAQKGIPSMDETKQIVESFKPCELFTCPTDLQVEEQTTNPD